MPVPTLYVDATGIHVPTYPEILEALQDEYRAIFGADAYIEPDSQDGQLLAIFALALADTNAAAVAVYNSFSPATAQGAGLSRQVKINGIARLASSYSTADVRIVGQAGTLLRNAQARDMNNALWNIPDLTIPPGGEIIVTAIAAEPGNIRADADTITGIATPTRGWQSVQNLQDAVPGRAVETDAELRMRQTWSTAIPSLSVFEGIIGAVADIEGVSRWRGYENDTPLADGNGLPGHSIAIVVEGGDALAIAKAIAAKKTPGTGTYGTTSVTVQDGYGVPSTIRFTRPTHVTIAMTVTIRPMAGYLSTTAQRLRGAVREYVNGLAIGEDVLLAKLYVPANLPGTPEGETYDILSIALARAGQEPTAANLGIGPFEAAYLDEDGITVEVTAG